MEKVGRVLCLAVVSSEANDDEDDDDDDNDDYIKLQINTNNNRLIRSYLAV